MNGIVPQAPTAKRAAFLTLAAPALLDACDASISALAVAAALPGLPTQTRIDIAKAMAKACEARHLAIFGRIDPPARRAIIKEDA